MVYAQVIRLTHPDAVLLKRCRTHDQAAFSEVVDRYKVKIYNYLYRMIGDAADAEDATQEVFVRLYTSLDSFRSQASLNTWLLPDRRQSVHRLLPALKEAPRGRLLAR